MTPTDPKLTMMAYLDGELSPEDKAAFEQKLESDEQLRRELDEFRRLNEDLASLSFADPTDEQLERYWQCVYNRLERRTGWLLFVAGVAGIAVYIASRFIHWVVEDTATALLLRAGISVGVLGLVVLFLSVLRERLAACKTDRYSREVKR